MSSPGPAPICCDVPAEPVELAITGELVGYVCPVCIEPVRSGFGISARQAGENLQAALRRPEPRLPDPGRCTHGRGVCERCDPWNAGRPEPRPVPGVKSWH